ncbi:MAG: M48 family metallopeptidase [Candidatus Hatepunaea meridiana]|nr:M48 family metallopeptidase [Candidatus Hatepunaea meridiana]
MLTFNGYLIFILAVLIGSYILELITERLNIKSLSPALPSEFEGFYDAEKYAKSQRYTREQTGFGLITSSFDIVLIVAFILLGGFNWLDQIARNIGWSEIPTGLIFAGIIIIGTQILHLPFSIYHTFVIEEKYGFNKTTPKTFVLDLLKELLLTIIIGGVVFAGVIWFFSQTGDLAWLYVWGAITAFQIFMMFIAPVVIMPLFNKFTPLEDGELKDSIEEYANKHNFKMKGVFTMDGSKRSSKSNAFFAGFGKTRRIALYDTLIEKHTIKEIVTVLAHEIGHYKLGHIPKRIVIAIISTGLMLFILSFFINNQELFDAFRMQELSIYASLIFFSFLYSPISMIIGIALNKSSRSDEFQADKFAADTTGYADDFAIAMKKLSVDSLSNLTPHPMKVFLEYDHPPVLARIKEVSK